MTASQDWSTLCLVGRGKTPWCSQGHREISCSHCCRDYMGTRQGCISSFRTRHQVANACIIDALLRADEIRASWIMRTPRNSNPNCSDFTGTALVSACEVTLLRSGLHMPWSDASQSWKAQSPLRGSFHNHFRQGFITTT